MCLVGFEFGKLQRHSVLHFLRGEEDRSHPRPAAGESMLLVPVLVQCGAANGNEGKVAYH
eukprot:567061-Amphidinium_carterae.1